MQFDAIKTSKDGAAHSLTKIVNSGLDFCRCQCARCFVTRPWRSNRTGTDWLLTAQNLAIAHAASAEDLQNSLGAACFHRSGEFAQTGDESIISDT